MAGGHGAGPVSVQGEVFCMDQNAERACRKLPGLQALGAEPWLPSAWNLGRRDATGSLVNVLAAKLKV